MYRVYQIGMEMSEELETKSKLHETHEVVGFYSTPRWMVMMMMMICLEMEPVGG